MHDIIDDNEIRMLKDAMGLGERKLSFPSLDSPYSRDSLLILKDVKGDRTYLKRLDKFVNKLREGLLKQAETECISLKAKKHAFLMALRHLVHTFANIAATPGNKEYVSISLNRNDYFGNGSQFDWLSYQALIESYKLLSTLKIDDDEYYVNVVKGHYQQASNAGLRTRLKPTKPFKDKLIQNSLIFPYHPYGFKKRRNQTGDKPLLEIKSENDTTKSTFVKALSRELNDDEKILPAINEQLKKLKIDIKLPNYAVYLESWNFDLGKSKLAHKSGVQLRRIFKNVDGNAGRIYGHWVQQCPKVLRKYVTFDGKPTVELDFSSMQLFLLYGLAGIQPPEGDLYTFEKIDRHWMKSVLTKSVGAASRSEAIQALHKEINVGAPKLHAKAEHFFNLFWERHNAVYPLLFKGETWSKLQNLDSIIALRVLAELVPQKIACIPIHDSFIVKQEYSAQLEAAMQTALQSVFPKLKPVIKH